jgi:hypothetical protein
VNVTDVTHAACRPAAARENRRIEKPSRGALRQPGCDDRWSASTAQENDMKLKLITAALLAMVVTAPAPADAGPLRNAWLRQKVSIMNGAATGRLTPGEYGRLRQRAVSIRNQAAFLRSTGGGLGPLERVYLGARLLGARAAIYRLKHN